MWRIGIHTTQSSGLWSVFQFTSIGSLFELISIVHFSDFSLMKNKIQFYPHLQPLACVFQISNILFFIFYDFIVFTTDSCEFHLNIVDSWDKQWWSLLLLTLQICSERWWLNLIWRGILGFSYLGFFLFSRFRVVKDYGFSMI